MGEDLKFCISWYLRKYEKINSHILRAKKPLLILETITTLVSIINNLND